MHVPRVVTPSAAPTSTRPQNYLISLAIVPPVVLVALTLILPSISPFQIHSVDLPTPCPHS